MTEGTQATILRRMTRQLGAEVAENPLTSSRAVRLALTKAADDTVGLALTVSSVAEETTMLDDMLGSLSDDLMLVGLERHGVLTGLIGLDTELRSAVLEMQTMGALLGQKAETRQSTRTDKMICDAVLDHFLSAFPAAVIGTPFDGWMDGITHTDRVDNTRAAGLILKDCDYRIVRMSVDLGIADRNGQLVIALPFVPSVEQVIAAQPVTANWSQTFHDAVSQAPASLDAVLHRFSVPLGTAQAFKVGSVVALPGCTVHSVRLIAPDGKKIGQAKLGQAGGYRAVRLEAAPAPLLADLPTAAPDQTAPFHDDNAIDLSLDIDPMEQGHSADVGMEPALSDDLELAIDGMADSPDLAPDQ